MKRKAWNFFHVVSELARDLLQDQPDPLKRVLGLIRSRDIPSLAQLGQPKDREYQDPEFFHLVKLRQVAACFKKNEAFADDTACAEQAHRNFELAERRCRITNKRLDHFYANPDRMTGKMRKWTETMERAIARILGDPRTFVDGLPTDIRLTDGATEDRSRRRSFPFLKITGKLRCTSGTVKWLSALMLFYGIDVSSCRFVLVSRNVIALVQKNWQTHRTIAKEPTHTLPFQLAIDSFVKRQLRRVGVDLSSQVRNQELAKKGSIDGSFATVDLEMASDTLAFNAVLWMLPFEWARIFLAFRSSEYKAPWGSGVYAKFSSMGNGYTFTLETLIFKAACIAVGSQQHAVYGDDIVIETEYVDDLIQLLAFLGFRTNVAKTFCNPDSRFRESCGADYYKGIRLTPFYCREIPLESHPASICHLLNGLIGVSSPTFWEFALCEASRLRLRFVPYNEDSRSGIFVDPGLAWRKGWLRTKRPSGREDRDRSDPDIGFPVYDGYGPRQRLRVVRGWRSLFLWYLRKGLPKGEDVTLSWSSRRSRFNLDLRTLAHEGSSSTHVEVSSFAEAATYIHRSRRFTVSQTSTPCHIWSFSDQVSRGLH
jgi:hypothetical protein